MHKSDYRVFAIDEETNQVVAFITAISDQVLCDAPRQDYYETFQMHRANGMLIRHYEKQSGK